MKIPGIIAIGNGEKCPYCDLTIDEHIDTFKHLMDNHAEQALSHLSDESEYNEAKADLIDEKIQQQEDDYREGVIGPGADIIQSTSE